MQINSSTNFIVVLSLELGMTRRKLRTESKLLYQPLALHSWSFISLARHAGASTSFHT